MLDHERHNYTGYSETESCLARQFLEKGYVIIDAEQPKRLDQLCTRVAETTARHLGIPYMKSQSPAEFLNQVHQHVTASELNALRLAVINDLRQDSEWFKTTYFSLARNALFTLVGNEIAMQRSVGLSVQLPNDESSLLPIHADVWDGDSPFEIVLWLPLVDCFATKSMYLVELPEDRKLQQQLCDQTLKDAESLFQYANEYVKFIDIPVGKVLLFSQTLMHGNRVNETPETRWSMNCRFKSVMSPYHDKKLIETFEPITLRPATRLGMHYALPTLKN